MKKKICVIKNRIYDGQYEIESINSKLKMKELKKQQQASQN